MTMNASTNSIQVNSNLKYYHTKGSVKPLTPLRERKCIIATEVPAIQRDSRNSPNHRKNHIQLPPLLIAGDYCEGSLGRGTVSGALISGERAAHYTQEIWNTTAATTLLVTPSNSP